jgi:hypothetical protein
MLLKELIYTLKQKMGKYMNYKIPNLGFYTLLFESYHLLLKSFTLEKENLH